MDNKEKIIELAEKVKLLSGFCREVFAGGWIIGYRFCREGVVYRFPEVHPMDIDHESEQDPQDTDAYRSTQDDMRHVAEQMRQTAREMMKGVVQTREEIHTMRDRLRREKNSYDRASS
jgi:hypothetical protein